MGLILTRLWSMLVCEMYTMHLLPICCGGSDIPPSNLSSRYGPPRTSPPRIIRKPIIQTKHLNGAGDVSVDCKEISVSPPPICTKNENLRIGNTKILCLIFPQPWSMLVWERYTRRLLSSCCDGSDFSPSNRPSRRRPPRASSPTLLDN